MAKRRREEAASPSASQAKAATKPDGKGKDGQPGTSRSSQGEQKKLERKRQKSEAAAETKVANELIEGPPGVSSPKPLPLRVLTRHRGVAWQWMAAGKMQYPIPIGCSRPLSPFNSSE
mmetsp:Transcript_51990/g.111252  ORF Transcript_51990/g.111252 Transcript_51990/m.111252 type:complete len:118 (-) Transcript_51990:47-400(-)